MRQKTIATVVGLAMLSAVCWPCNADNPVGKETTLWNWTQTDKHHDSVVKVSLDDGSGSGVIVHVDRDKPSKKGFLGYCLTAYHVVKPDNGRQSITVTYRNGRSSQHCKVMAFDEQLDVALIWVWVPASIEPAAVASDKVREGDILEYVGLGGGSRLSCMRHFSAAAAAPTDNDTIFADVTLLSGDSGGPVFNERKEVVGVISGGWFWWDGGVTTSQGARINVTWPARACNVGAVQRLIKDVQPLRVAGR